MIQPPPVNRAAAARSAKWSLVENGGMALISIASLIVYAHFLSAAQFGVFSIALAVIELMAVLVSMLFHDALVQRGDVRELHYDTAFTATLMLSGVLTALCWAIGSVLAEPGEWAAAGPVLAWLSLSLPFTALSATLVARRRRALEFRVLALRQLFGRITGAAIGIALVVLGFGLWGLVVQHVLLIVLGSLVLWVHCADRPRLRFGMREWRELIGFGLASASALLGHFGVKRAFIIVSGFSLGPYGAGLLNLSFRAIDGLWALGWTTVSQIALPVLSAVRSDSGRFRRAFQKASAFACVVLYFGFVLIAATAPELVALLFGPQWEAVAPYVSLLALQVVVQARRVLFQPTLTALGRPRELLISPAAEFVFLAALIAPWGVPSVGWAIGLWLARDVLGGSLEAWLVARAEGVRIRELLGTALVPLAAAVVMFSLVWFCRQLLPEGLAPAVRLALLAASGTVAYFACVAALQRGLLVELFEFIRSAFRPRHAGAPIN